MKPKLLLVLIFVLAFSVRVFKLPELPGEWYGDISNVHEYTEQILAGEWPFYFFQSPGPVYHYLIAPITLIFRNQGYLTYKISSVVISLFGIFGIYLFAKEMSGKKAALITALISSFSFWYLVWSRTGNSQAVIPAIIAFSAYFLARFVRLFRTRDLISSVLIASLGWFTYPQTFIIPPLITGFLFINLLINSKKRDSRRYFLILMSSVIIGLLPFVFVFSGQTRGMSDNFGKSGYLGSKLLPLLEMNGGQIAYKTVNNLYKTYLSLHFEGDRTFRINIPGKPHLDPFSGAFFIAGIYYLFARSRKQMILFVIISLFILPVPSANPTLPQAEIPNSGRTIALIPFAYLLCGMGVLQFISILKNINHSFSVVLVSLVFMIPVYINQQNYFRTYALQLPDNNLGPSGYIAKFIDRNTPENAQLYFAECCWGEAGEPEPKAIVYQLENSGRKSHLEKLVTECDEIKVPAILVARDFSTIGKFKSCTDNSRRHEILSKDRKYITTIFIVE